MFGSQRAKRACIATNMAELQAISKTCDGQHLHLAWGQTPFGFATAAEVAYPKRLCQEWAQCVLQHLAARFTLPVPKCLQSPDKAARASAGRQTKRSPAFMPDYNEVMTLQRSVKPAVEANTTLKQPVVCKCNPDAVLPAGSHILRFTRLNRGVIASEAVLDDVQSDFDAANPLLPGWEVAFGMPWSCDGFVAEAVRRGHPANFFDSLSESMMEAIRKNALLKPSQVVSFRANWFKRWTARALELRGEEKRLMDALPPHRRKVLQGKRLVLLREILQDAGYPDVKLAEDIAAGFDLVGETERSEAMPDHLLPATISIDELLDTAPGANRGIYHSTKSCGDPQVDEQLWEKTAKELADGWLVGPLPISSVESEGRLSRRFPIVQGGKVRPIDNYSESQVNDAITVVNRATVDGTDVQAAMAASLIRELDKAGASKCIKGMSFDLTSAYRQLAVSDKSLRFARVCVYNPKEGVAQCYQQHTLPFGARASVAAFIRCARMLQWLGHQLLLIVSCFFDDYVLLSPEVTSCNAELSFSTLLDLLGWPYDKTGDKSDTMTQVVRSLGVELVLRESPRRFITVKNTEKRVAELLQCIEQILCQDRVTKTVAVSLKGRLGFAQGQIFGRTMRRLINELTAVSLGQERGDPLSENVKRTLREVSALFKDARPRKVSAFTNEVCYIFTDASFEPESCEGGIGAVLVSPQGTIVSWFSHMLSKEECRPFMRQGQRRGSDNIGCYQDVETCGGCQAYHFLCGQRGLSLCNPQGLVAE